MHRAHLFFFKWASKFTSTFTSTFSKLWPAPPCSPLFFFKATWLPTITQEILLGKVGRWAWKTCSEFTARAWGRASREMAEEHGSPGEHWGSVLSYNTAACAESCPGAAGWRGGASKAQPIQDWTVWAPLDCSPQRQSGCNLICTASWWRGRCLVSVNCDFPWDQHLIR